MGENKASVGRYQNYCVSTKTFKNKRFSVQKVHGIVNTCRYDRYVLLKIPYNFILETSKTDTYQQKLIYINQNLKPWL